MEFPKYTVFINGHPKSGTSLLNALLDCHPELIVLPEESDYYNGIWPTAKILNMAWRMSRKQKSRHFLKKIKASSHLRNLFRGKVDLDISGNLFYRDFDTNTFTSLLLNKFEKNNKFDRPNTFLNIISSFAQASGLSERNEPKYWVEKTPRNTWYLKEITKDFPDALFLFIYRDPRDNYVSYKKKWPKQNALRFSKTWNETF